MILRLLTRQEEKQHWLENSSNITDQKNNGRVFTEALQWK